MQKSWRMVSVYSIAHFAVDFACAFLMFRSISASRDWYTCILLYNFCAFAMQMPIGVVADRLNRNHVVASIGCVLVAAGYALAATFDIQPERLTTYLPLATAVVIGLGNGMFHIGGGIDVLNICAKKYEAQSEQRKHQQAGFKGGLSSGLQCAPLGVFVSPGAFGVYFGTILGKRSDFPPLPITLTIITALLIAALIIYGAGAKRRKRHLTQVENPSKDSYVENAEFSLTTTSPALASAICLFLVVCLRSYVGLAIDFLWKSAGYWGLALVCATVLGKAAGGFLADLFGTQRTAIISLGIAALLFLFPNMPIAGVAAILLFNMSMPITLYCLATLFPGAKGFSFGLLTFALFLGFLPVHFGAATPPFWLFPLLAAVSPFLLYIGLRKIERGHSAG